MERGQKSLVSHRDCAVEHIDLASGCCELGLIGEGSSASTHPVCVANSRADLAQSLAPGHGARRVGLPRLSGAALVTSAPPGFGSRCSSCPLHLITRYAAGASVPIRPAAWACRVSSGATTSS